MIIVSQLIDLACWIGGPRFAYEMELRRLQRWQNFEPEYYLLDHFVDPRRVAIDVGANEGYYSGRLSQLCAQVHCFEPIPWMADNLRRRLRPSVRVHQLAVSDHNGEGVLRVPYRGAVEMHGTSTIEPGNPLREATHTEEVPCRLVRLDDVIDEHVGFIKVDVEGHELAVLQGAAALIAKDRPVLLVESEKRHNAAAPESVFEFLRELGYTGLFVEEGRLRLLSHFRFADHQRPDNLADGTRKVGVYVNNFVFLPG